ncbi:hypothetical protein MTO96_013669 [Rhipicephalus appendiculatus]
MSLKVYDKDFEMYVDMDDESVIPDKAKLLIKETVQYRIVDVLNVEEAAPSTVIDCERTVYVLPNMPLDVKLSIDRHQQGQYFGNRRRVLQWLYNDLSTYKMYPGKLYEEAARALIVKFPTLADSTGTGYDLNLNDAEDEESVAAHTAGMQREMRKANPGYEYLVDSMSRTFADRRLWISRELPGVADVVEKYPALTTSTINPEATYVFPKVTYTGSSIFDATMFVVRLEHISIIEDSLLAAVATQIALYWVFDIVFDPKAKKSLDLFCRAAHVDSGLSPTPLIRLAAALFE